MHQDSPAHPAHQPRGGYVRTDNDDRLTHESCREILGSLDSGFCVIELKFDEQDYPVDYKFLAVNSAFQKHSGLIGAVGKWMRELRPTHEQYWFDVYGRVALTGEPTRFEKHSDSLDKWYEVNAFRIGNPYEHTVAILFKDITARKRALAELALAKERLELAVDVAELGLFEIDLLKDTIKVNRAGKKVYQWSNEDSLKFSEAESYFHPEDRDRILRDLKNAFDPSGPGEFSIEHRIIRKDGEVRWIKAKGRAFFSKVDGKQKATRCIGSYLDVTEQKGEEIQLENYTRTLEATNKKLVESNQRLDDFVHIVSHDLKEPVRGIYNFSTFLLEDFEGKLNGGEEELKTLKKLCLRLNDLIEDLLKYARIGKENNILEKIDLKELIDSVLELMEPQIEAGNVAISVQERLPTIRCSKVHLTEIFRNLIVNGIKYNDNSKKKIEIGFLENHPRHREGYVFFVKDNGIGIAEKHRETVFKIFRRLHGRDQYGGGTGSGLAIVKKLVEEHQGEVWIESNPEGGSLVLFYLNCV